MMRVQFKYISKVVLFLFAVMLCIFPAIENGYPLLFVDAATYIKSGHTLQVPIDRPIFYGFFVRHISMSWSLWLVIIFQSMILCFLLLKTIKEFLKPQKPYLILLLLCLLLSWGTGVGHYTAQISPDIFTVIGFLSLNLLLFGKGQSGVIKIVLTILLFFSSVSHLSNIPIFFGLTTLVIGVTFIINKANAFRKKMLLKLIFPLIIISLSLPITSLTNYLLGAGSSISKVSYTVQVAKLAGTSIVNDYLKRTCDEKSQLPYSEICNYIDQFKRWPAAGFYLHSEDSPLYSGSCIEKGWENCWVEKNEMYELLIKDILSEPDLRQDYIATVIIGSLKQFFHFEQAKIDPFPFEIIIEDYYKDDILRFKNATQHSRALIFSTVGVREGFIVLGGLFLTLLVLILRWNRIPMQSKRLIFLTLGLLVLNAVVCATFSNVVPRYQGRVIFLIPIFIFLCSLKWLKDSKFNIHLNELL